MTNKRASKIILDLINAGEAEYRNFSVEEIRALKKAYVALNSEPTTNADRIRAMTDEELAEFLERKTPWYRCKECKWESCKDCCLDWLKEEARTND